MNNKKWRYTTCAIGSIYLDDQECIEYLKKLNISKIFTFRSSYSLIPQPVNPETCNQEIYEIIKQKQLEHKELKYKQQKGA
jgi:hypothetical protein